MLQDKVASLTKTKDKCTFEALSVTKAEVELAIACADPADAVTADLFCWAMGWLAFYGGSPACDVIASAGAIPVIMQLLACFYYEKMVTIRACYALYCLADKGSEAIRSTLRAQPDIVSLLRAASTRLREWGEYDHAAEALRKLGL